jgi:biopolymer transport protein ExbD
MITATNEVYFHDNKMTLDQLRHMLAKEAARSTDQQVVIQSDGRVPYQTIVEVMDMAFQFKFRAVNLATRAGIASTPAPK